MSLKGLTIKITIPEWRCHEVKETRGAGGGEKKVLCALGMTDLGERKMQLRPKWMEEKIYRLNGWIKCCLPVRVSCDGEGWVSNILGC